MADTRTSQATPCLRITRRLSMQPVIPLTVETVRPSLLDFRLKGDCWIVARSAGFYGLCFDNRPLVYLSASPVDVISLNMLVDRIRHRVPRRRIRLVARRA